MIIAAFHHAIIHQFRRTNGAMQSARFFRTTAVWNNMPERQESCCSKRKDDDKGHRTTSSPLGPSNLAFWSDKATWVQAATNTTRCLVGCSVGDLIMLFITQFYGFSMSTSMVLSMASGLTTSFALETFWLKAFNNMSLSKAAETAFGMSMISMLSMEAAENFVNLALTGGQFAPNESWWWAVLGTSLAAGFVTPLPYNYYMLRKYGKSCH